MKTYAPQGDQGEKRKGTALETFSQNKEMILVQVQKGPLQRWKPQVIWPPCPSFFLVFSFLDSVETNHTGSISPSLSPPRKTTMSLGKAPVSFLNSSRATRKRAHKFLNMTKYFFAFCYSEQTLDSAKREYKLTGFWSHAALAQNSLRA